MKLKRKMSREAAPPIDNEDDANSLHAQQILKRSQTIAYGEEISIKVDTILFRRLISKPGDK